MFVHIAIIHYNVEGFKHVNCLKERLKVFFFSKLKRSKNLQKREKYQYER